MSFPTTSILDHLNRTETPLSDGGNWGAAEGLASLYDGTSGAYLNPSDPTPIEASYWTTGFALPVEVYVEVAVLPAEGGNSATLGWVQPLGNVEGGGSNGYQIALLWGGTGWALRLLRSDSGSLTQIAVVNPVVGVTPAAGDSFGMSISAAGLITGWYDSGGTWSNQVSVTDTTYTGTGYLELWTPFSDTTVRYTNFGGGVTVTSSPPAAPPPLVAGIFARRPS